MPRLAAKWQTWLAGVSLTVALAVAAVAWRPAPVTNLETATVVRGDVVSTLEVEGSAESARNLDITCQVVGGSTILWIIPDGTQVHEGDELVRFDSSAVEDLLSQQAVVVEQARAAQIAAEHELSAAKLALPEYVEGTFVELDQEAEVAITTAAHNLRSARNNLAATKQLIRRGFLTHAQLEPSVFAVEQAQLQLEIARRAKTVLETYNRPKMTQDLRSRLETAEAVVRSTTAEFELAQKQLAHYHQQLERCVVRAPRGGLAIHANDPGRSSSETPDVEMGAFIRERQKVIWLPDLSSMQVRALVHESSVLRVHPGLAGVVSVRGRELPAVVSEVATQPARTRRSQAHLKYFMVTALIDEPSPGLRPGESIDLTLLVNYRPGVLRTPLETVVKADDGAYAWVEGDGGIESRRIELGEMGDSMAEVKRGLREGDHVVLNPRDNLSEVDELLDAHVQRHRDRFGQVPTISSVLRWLATAGG